MLNKKDFYYKNKTLHEVQIPLNKSLYQVLSAIEGKEMLEKHRQGDEGEIFSRLSFRINLNYSFDVFFYIEPVGYSIKLCVDDDSDDFVTIQSIENLNENFIFSDNKEQYCISFVYDDETGFSKFEEFSADEILSFYGLKETALCPSCECSILEEGVYITHKEKGYFDEEGYYTTHEEEEPVTCCANCEYEFDEDELCELLGNELKF